MAKKARRKKTSALLGVSKVATIEECMTDKNSRTNEFSCIIHKQQDGE